MTAKKEISPINKSDFFESGLNKKGSKKQTFTRDQVNELLRQQIADCADSIQGNNLSEYCAKKKILETKIVEVVH